MKKLIIVLMLSSAFACKETSDDKRSELELFIEQSMDRNADSLLSKKEFNSVSIGVYKNGKTFTRHFSELDKGKGNTPNDSTIYEIVSLIAI